MKRLIRRILNILFIPINKIYFEIFTLANKENILERNDLVQELGGEKILILAPHVDDETIGCGGAILKYKGLGKDLSVCYLTKSQKRGSKSSSQDIEAERRDEAYQLAKEVGIPKEKLFFLSGEDGNLINSPIEDEFLETIRLVKPDTIFLPVFLDTHVDHYASSIKLLEAYRSKPDLFEGIEIFLYESQSPISPIYSNKILNISDVFDRKLQLLKVFKSQRINLKSIENSNGINGLAPREKACEVFINMPIGKYIEEFDKSRYRSEEEFLSLRKNLKQNRDSLSLIGSYRTSLEYKKDLKEIIK